MEGWTTIFVRSMTCPNYCMAECGADTPSGSMPPPLANCTSVLILMIWRGLRCLSQVVEGDHG